MVEVRCHNKDCNRLLLKLPDSKKDLPFEVEIKCPKCKYINVLEINLKKNEVKLIKLDK